jgi:hypothetical protein
MYRVNKPNSVFAEAKMIINLGSASLLSSCGTSAEADTALHSGKDLAVSPLFFNKAIPEGISHLSN